MADRFEADLAAMVKEIGDPQEQAKRFARYAAEEIEEARAINRRALGKDVPYSVQVDGRAGAALTSVRANSVVIAEWRLVEEALEWIGRALLEESPVLTGAYRNSIRMFADGIEHLPGEAIPEAKEYSFLATVPYARKIEGSNGRPPQSDQAPDGVFEVVATMARKRFDNVAAIKFTWEALVAGDASTRQPAIRVRPY